MDVFAVEAFAASWIEIGQNRWYSITVCTSKPLRLRGLKYLSWDCKYDACIVEAFAASWIEIGNTRLTIGSNWSKPLRLRGLKSAIVGMAFGDGGRSLCGFVD